MPAATPIFPPTPLPTPDSLVRLRKRMGGLTAKSMASLLSVSYATYLRWEYGQLPVTNAAARMIGWLELGYRPPEFDAADWPPTPDRRPPT